MRITILTNGPGELWGWVRPMTAELRQRGHSVSLWLLPCPFASGHEREAASLLGVDKLEGPSGAAGLWRSMAEEGTDCVLQLGGDLLFGAHIAKAAKVPLACYTYGPKKGLKGVRVFTAFPSQALGIDGAVPIGDLVKDALAMDAQTSRFSWEPPRESVESPRVVFLPGSRPAIRQRALPWLALVKAELKAKIPDVRIHTLFPPFVPDFDLKAWRDAGLSPVRAGAGAVMRDADFALTQPGTNTLELMHCGVPSLVVAPSSFLDLVPVAGLLGMAASLPGLGPVIRRKAVQRVLKRWGGMISLPNRIAGRSVMDEKLWDVTPQQAAEGILARLRDPEALTRMRTELLALSGEPGAAGRLCDALTGGAE